MREFLTVLSGFLIYLMCGLLSGNYVYSRWPCEPDARIEKQDQRTAIILCEWDRSNTSILAAGGLWPFYWMNRAAREITKP